MEQATDFWGRFSAIVQTWPPETWIDANDHMLGLAAHFVEHLSVRNMAQFINEQDTSKPVVIEALARVDQSGKDRLLIMWGYE